MKDSEGRAFLNSVEITPSGFFLCLLASIPAFLISKLFIAITTPIAKSLVEDAHFEGSYGLPLCYFVIYGLGGYFFVWTAGSLTQRFRPFDILLYFVLVTITGLVLIPEITSFGALGAAWGALAALFFLAKAFMDSSKNRKS